MPFYTPMKIISLFNMLFWVRFGLASTKTISTPIKFEAIISVANHRLPEDSARGCCGGRHHLFIFVPWIKLLMMILKWDHSAWNLHALHVTFIDRLVQFLLLRHGQHHGALPVWKQACEPGSNKAGLRCDIVRRYEEMWGVGTCRIWHCFRHCFLAALAASCESCLVWGWWFGMKHRGRVACSTIWWCGVAWQHERLWHFRLIPFNLKFIIMLFVFQCVLFIDYRVFVSFV